ncbi:hypothetical protein [Halovenus halobia]|uniref:HVO_A0114 family putative DNA-binding protein n=1 Tax=Halovenus halobia TaxID=3396622 RepID=UPI003F56ACF2
MPHVVNFEDRARLRQILTDRRMELLDEVMDRPQESIRALATRLDRDVHDILDNLHLLAEYDIIHFEENGRAKKPYVPYETSVLRLSLASTVKTPQSRRLRHRRFSRTLSRLHTDRDQSCWKSIKLGCTLSERLGHEKRCETNNG